MHYSAVGMTERSTSVSQMNGTKTLASKESALSITHPNNIAIHEIAGKAILLVGYVSDDRTKR